MRSCRGCSPATPRRPSKNSGVPGWSMLYWRNPSFRGYADYAMDAAFAAGLVQLRRLAAERRTAMMCSEALWWRCHRRLIADRLVVAGDTVCHISSTGRTSAHLLTPFAAVAGDGSITYPAG